MSRRFNGECDVILLYNNITLYIRDELRLFLINSVKIEDLQMGMNIILKYEQNGKYPTY